ncbi:hypothetical protein FHU38_000141 [Saccharomonospora amisosensis]|uniref:Uncharacterized protein n=2 Tax=Saccharomonospora TaxID=1851 RepID=H5X632_9PSEU|nr:MULTISPECIES: hypothetical protein [Saccharomonospora]EHR53431.1 hypothetical protein SacmaDRAFT_5281 [Saccharomonospora marina XMU15]NIJ09797.1 hypothetical protein [Saccharomonospora amisosensis]
MNHNTDDPPVYAIDPDADPGPLPETALDSFIENGCTVRAVVIDPADAQQLLYGVVTGPDGKLVGTYYPADTVRGARWRIVTADGTHYHAADEYHAVHALVTRFATD